MWGKPHDYVYSAIGEWLKFAPCRMASTRLPCTRRSRADGITNISAHKRGDHARAATHPTFRRSLKHSNRAHIPAHSAPITRPPPLPSSSPPPLPHVDEPTHGAARSNMNALPRFHPKQVRGGCSGARVRATEFPPITGVPKLARVRPHHHESGQCGPTCHDFSLFLALTLTLVHPNAHTYTHTHT